MTQFTWWSLAHGLHDKLKLLEGQHSVFVPVEEHEDLFELCHLVTEGMIT